MNEIPAARPASAEPDSIIAHYRRHAQAWAQDRGTDLPERTWLDQFRALLPPDATVLDIGCGSGQPIARHFSGHGIALTGIDAAPEMIALCTAHAPHGDWHVADMRTLALGRAFDGILAWDSLFHLDHDAQRRMFPIFRAHAAPSAALMFTTGTSHGTAIGTYAGNPLYHASLDPAEYRQLLDRHGFKTLSHVTKDPACDRNIWLARLS